MCEKNIGRDPPTPPLYNRKLTKSFSGLARVDLNIQNQPEQLQYNVIILNTLILPVGRLCMCDCVSLAIVTAVTCVGYALFHRPVMETETVETCQGVFASSCVHVQEDGSMSTHVGGHTGQIHSFLELI